MTLHIYPQQLFNNIAEKERESSVRIIYIIENVANMLQIMLQIQNRFKHDFCSCRKRPND